MKANKHHLHNLMYSSWL